MKGMGGMGGMPGMGGALLPPPLLCLLYFVLIPQLSGLWPGM